MDSGTEKEHLEPLMVNVTLDWKRFTVMEDWNTRKSWMKNPEYFSVLFLQVALTESEC